MSILNANWIKAGESMGDVVPVFSKVIEVCDPQKAEISVSAKGVYCLYINGKRVSDYVLAPGWTVYEKRLQYQTYDVTNMLKNGENIELTQVEFQMIEYFFTNPDTALGRTDILTKVWGSNYFGEEKIVDVNVRRLRMKIEDDPSVPKRLMTVWGMGYKWSTR